MCCSSLKFIEITEKRNCKIGLGFDKKHQLKVRVNNVDFDEIHFCKTISNQFNEISFSPARATRFILLEL